MIHATATRPPAAVRVALAHGVHLHVRDDGASDGTPVVFLHGMMGHHREWDVLLDRLRHRHRVVAVDQRGHGRSDRSARYRPSDMAADATAVIEALDLAPAAIAGHSMGGMVALIAAAQRPDLVDRIVVIDLVPQSLEMEFAEQLPGILEAMAAASFSSLEEALAEWRTANPRARPDLLRHYLTHALVRGADGRLRWGFDAHGLRTFTDDASTAELWTAVDAIACPVLLVRGEHSAVTTRDATRKLAERLGDADVVEIEGGGHDLGVERPEAVAEAVTRFLAARAPGRAAERTAAR